MNTNENKEKSESGGKLYQYPPFSLLNRTLYDTFDFTQELKDKAIKMQKLLFQFGISAKFLGIYISPRFVRFEIQIPQSIRINQIKALSENIKYEFMIKELEIEAPIPGRNSIAIDILNEHNYDVAIRNIIATKEFSEYQSYIKFSIGIDRFGKPLFSDLNKTNNILIGGQTGSGKTSFIDNVILSVLYADHPNYIQFIMIDTRGANLHFYNGIPHLLIPVITDIKKANAALIWSISEIKSRYQKFGDYGVKDINEYNRKISNTNEYRLPHIAIIIDDFSDLISYDKKETEYLIREISRLSRAAGFSLIISTQRPSSNVVSSNIKYNIRNRIAFKTFSTVDSTVILDEKGAESLFGNGDMLIKKDGERHLIRAQSPYVTLDEINRVVDFFKSCKY